MSELTTEELIARSRAMIARADALLARYEAPADCSSDVTDLAADVTHTQPEFPESIKAGKKAEDDCVERANFATHSRVTDAEFCEASAEDLADAHVERSTRFVRRPGAEFCEEPTCHICAGCGQPFQSRRRDARCCSPACRQRVSRARRRTGDSQVICDSVRGA